MAIGRRPSDARDFDFAGYISDARIVKGSAVYTENFTPPTSPLTAVSGTQLLTLQNRIGYNNSQPIDESGLKNVITRNGNASAGSFSPYVPTGWSAYFDGTSDYLSIPDNSAFDLGTGDFTLELWASFQELSTSTATGDDFLSGNGSGDFDFAYVNNSLRLGRFQISWDSTFSFTPNLNQWYHIAYTRSSGTLRVFVDGSLIGSGSNTNSYNVTGTVLIGIDGDSIYRPMKGYISNLRLIKGTAVYTSNFTPPTAPLEPITNTSLLTLRGPSFTDDGPNRFAITRNGDTKITPFSPFAPHTVAPDSYSVYFDGSDEIVVDHDPVLDIFNGDYTVEAWIWSEESQTTNSGITGKGGSTTGWTFNVSGTNVLVSYAGTTGLLNSNATAGGLVTIQQWHHVAFCRSGSTIRLFLNGTMVDSVVRANNDNTTNNLKVGTNRVNSVDFKGYISNLRIVGSALYDSDSGFTPSTTPLTDISNTAVLMCNSTKIEDTSSNQLVVSTINGTPYPTKFNPFGETVTTGVEYSPLDHKGSVYFDGNDALSLDTAAGLILDSDFTIESWVYVIPGQNTQCLINTSSHTTLAISLNRTGIGDTYVYLGNGSSWLATPAINSNSAGKNLAFNSWNHVALVRFGSTITLYHNGEVAGTTTTIPSGFTGAAVIGGLFGYTTERLKGYVSNFRVVKGTAVYTSAFVPPQSPVDPTSGTILLTCNNHAAIQDKSGRNVLETVGNTRTLPESPYRFNKSVYFDGTGDYLTAPTNAAFAFGTGDFTVEGWLNTTSLASEQAIFDSLQLGGNYTRTTSFVFVVATTGSLRFYTNSAYSSSTSNSVTTGQWFHFAMVRSNGTIKIYINGVEGLSVVNATNFSDTGCVIGRYSDTSNAHFNGYISNLRIVKGTAVYTSNFTPPTSPLTAIANTSLLTCQSYNFKDNSSNDFTITRNGDARISSRGPFTETQTSDNAMYFDGTGDYLQLKDNPEFVFGTGAFTIEGWIYLTSTGIFRHIYDQRPTSTDGDYPTLRINVSNEMEYVAGGTSRITSSVLSQSTWYHFALARSGTSTKLFIDGTQAGSTYTDSTNYLCGTNRPFVGGSGYHVTTLLFQGFIDDLRITKGVARYTTTFTPPTSTYTLK
jgi:hypothetical protein